MDFGILGIATSGMRAQQTQVDAVGHNLANLQTTGFRAIRPDLVAAAPQAGVEVGAVLQPDVGGPTLMTNSPLDLALPPGVYLAVQLPNGQTGLSRTGNLRVGNDGRLQAGDFPLVGNIRLAPTDSSPSVDATGQVTVPAGNGPLVGQRVVGKLPLVTVARPEGLSPQGNGIWMATATSGTGTPFTATAAAPVVPGAVNGSNVDVIQEMTHLVRAQRAYQINAQMVHVWDELASQTVQDLGRG